METVKHGQTGFLCDQTASSFGAAVLQFIEKPELAAMLGCSAREHVSAKFTRPLMQQRLSELIDETANTDNSNSRRTRLLSSRFAVILIFLIFLRVLVSVIL